MEIERINVLRDHLCYYTRKVLQNELLFELAAGFTDELKVACIGAIGEQKLTCVVKVACKRFGSRRIADGSVSVLSGHR